MEHNAHDNTQPTPTSRPQVLLVTGLSGAGRGSSAKILEDLGWYVADNVPISLIPQLIAIHEAKHNSQSNHPAKIALVLDVRTSSFTPDFDSVHTKLVDMGIDSQVLFLNANDSVLIRRFEHVKRPHPLQQEKTLSHGISSERQLLRSLQEKANYVIDTSDLSTHDLRRELTTYFSDSQPPELAITIQSFGFKHGIPLDTDMLLDVRFIPNPHWVESLKPHTGLDPQVAEYVLSQKNVDTFITGHIELLLMVLEGYRNDGKSYFTLTIGCTGGKHRSVAVAQEIYQRLSTQSQDKIHIKHKIHVKHRDAGLE